MERGSEGVVSADLTSELAADLTSELAASSSQNSLRRSGGFKGWPGVAWPPHFKAHSHSYSSTTGMNSTDLYCTQKSFLRQVCSVRSALTLRLRGPHPQIA